MKTHHIAALSLFVLLGALIISPFVPKLVAAQTAIIPSYTSNCGVYTYAPYNTTNCNPGILHVYVTVTNSNQYGNYNFNTPSNFTATVTSQNSSPVSFSGSQSGTNLSVVGQYSVTAAAMPGYAPTYSVGCNDSLINGREGTCIITENNTSSYTQIPVPYPYPYAVSNLSCSPSYQTVGLGQSATFSVQGVTSGPFNWSTSNRSYQAIGPLFSTTFSNTGTQLVTVMSGSQLATCTVNVVAGAAVNYISPANPIFPVTTWSTPNTVSITSGYAPTLPNTGFAPLNSFQIATLLGILLSLGIFLTPYVRKTLVLIG